MLDRFPAGESVELVVSQTFLPERWVILDDGSTDQTAKIVARYTKDYRWIELIRRPQRKDRNFAGKVYAFNEGLAQVQPVDVE